LLVTEAKERKMKGRRGMGKETGRRREKRRRRSP
jgi:hypothetical protein